MRTVLAIGVLGAGLLACTQNFDVFLTDSGTTPPSDAKTESGGGMPDAGCDASPACTMTAKTCADGCRDAGAQCIAGCSNNGCKNNCMGVQANCITKCRTDCVTCAGSACTSVCQTATN